MENFNVIVTGASRGIGREVALSFARNKCNVAVIYAGNTASANETVDEIAKLGVKAVAYQCDVADFTQTKDVVDAIAKEFGTIDVLVNNAGVTADMLIMRMSEQMWDSVIDTNLKGAFNMTKHVGTKMLRAKKGAIVNVSSVVGLMGNAGQANYCASKAGIIGLTKATAREFASRGITVNAVAPGFIETDMTGALTSDQVEMIKKQIPLLKTGSASDVASAVVFLATNKYITGETIKVDGGMYI